jgi:hypothetical protein
MNFVFVASFGTMNACQACLLTVEVLVDWEHRQLRPYNSPNLSTRGRSSLQWSKTGEDVASSAAALVNIARVIETGEAMIEHNCIVSFNLWAQWCCFDKRDENLCASRRRECQIHIYNKSHWLHPRRISSLLPWLASLFS